jgi:hypothetical protein
MLAGITPNPPGGFAHRTAFLVFPQSDGKVLKFGEWRMERTFEIRVAGANTESFEMRFFSRTLFM